MTTQDERKREQPAQNQQTASVQQTAQPAQNQQTAQQTAQPAQNPQTVRQTASVQQTAPAEQTAALQGAGASQVQGASAGSAGGGSAAGTDPLHRSAGTGTAYGNQAGNQAAAQNGELDALAQEARRSAQAGQLAQADTSAFRSYLDQWRQNAVRQAEGRGDYAVQQGTRELNRAQAETEEQYRTQLAQISAEEARARDNQALYNAAQGNRGGIGAAQLDQIAAAAMTNRNTLTNARNKAAREIRQQIADLRAQNEYQKADAALEIGNQYLIQLRELEQWAQQYNLTVDQFNAQLNQTLMNYLAQVQAQKIETQRWAEQMGFQREQFQYSREQDVLDRQERAEERDYARAWNEDERTYSRGQDALDRQERQEERDYARAWNEDERTYSRGQDALNRQERQARYDVEDARYEDATAYSRQQDALNRQERQNRYDVEDARYEDATAYSRQQDALNRQERQNRYDVEDARYEDATAYSRQQDALKRSDSLAQQDFNNNITLRQLNNAEDQQRITNARTAQQDAESRAQTARNRLASTAQALLNAGVSIADSPDMLDALGMTADQSELYRSAAQQGLVSSGSTVSGTSNAGSAGSIGAVSGGTEAQNLEALFEAASSSSVPENFISEHYKQFGFKKSSGLSAAYKKWAEDESNLLTHGPARNTAEITGRGADTKITAKQGTGAVGDAVPFNFDPDEGIVTINGKTFSDSKEGGAFDTYMKSLNLSREQWIGLYNKMGLYGSTFSKARETILAALAGVTS